VRLLLALVLVCAAAGVASVASAQAEPDWEAPWAGRGDANGERPRPRAGFFLRMGGSMGPAFLFSDANPLSGFEQGIATETSGFGFGLDGELGFEVVEGWSLGAYLSFAYASELRVHVRDRVATLDPGALENVGLGVALTHEPWRGSGYHFSLRAGFGGLQVTTELPFDDSFAADIDSRELGGWQLTLIAGKEWRVYGGIWGGLALRLSYAGLTDGRDIGPSADSTWVAPSVALTASWF
jgi:hypothetical protein